MTLLEAQERVIAIMKRREPDKVLDPDVVRFVAELLVELAARQHEGEQK